MLMLLKCHSRVSIIFVIIFTPLLPHLPLSLSSFQLINILLLLHPQSPPAVLPTIAKFRSSSVIVLSLSKFPSFSLSSFVLKMDFGKLSSPFNCLMFDLDDTLYSSHTGIAAALKKNIEDYLTEKCGFSRSQASILRVELFMTYGSSLAGLRALGYDIDADDYHSFVHGRLPYEQIKPNPQLRNILLSITQRKIIFTNSDREHAKKVLKRLGIEDCFEQMICFETLNPNLSKATRPDEFPVVLKPSLDAMNIAIDAAHVDPHRTLFLDDNVKNVAAGKAVGLKTALVGKTTKSLEADYALETVNNLAQAIPEIWMMRKSSSDQDDEQPIGRTRSDIENLLAVGA